MSVTMQPDEVIDQMADSFEIALNLLAAMEDPLDGVDTTYLIDGQRVVHVARRYAQRLRGEA